MACANNSMSPTTGTPRAAAWRTSASAGATPGLMAIMSTAEKLASRQAPACNSAWGSSRASAAAWGGASRLSATRTFAPQRVSHFAMEKPVSPSPSTSTLLPASCMWPAALI
ncbi:MAG: hypothetical protein NT115_14900 [Proteobacteria bacterium]|nr:hypothetical protein [Pseudomonadota bacterium]